MHGKNLNRNLAGRSPGLGLDKNKSLASGAMVSMLVGSIAGSAIPPRVCAWPSHIIHFQPTFF